MYELRQVKGGDKRLFCRLNGVQAERHGAVGHLLIYFGCDGFGYTTTWIENQNHLKTSAFKASLDTLVRDLRKDILEDRDEMRFHCKGSVYGSSLGKHVTGFKFHQDGFTYYLRCNPGGLEYDAYLFAYDDRFLFPELAGKHKLPNCCFTLLPSTGEMIRVTRGESGYYPCGVKLLSADKMRLLVNGENAQIGVTRAQEEAMLAGSLFGWNTPAAKPWRYDSNGDLLPAKRQIKAELVR